MYQLRSFMARASMVYFECLNQAFTHEHREVSAA